MEFYSFYCVYYVYYLQFYTLFPAFEADGIQEVSGSIPLVSTNALEAQGFSVFLFYFPNFLIDFGLWLQKLDHLYFSEF